MIDTGKQLVENYSSKFKAAGGDPEACDGVLWAKDEIKRDSGATANDIITQIVQKVESGTADHGWIIGILDHLWSSLSQQQRLILIKALSAGGAHKVLIGRKSFRDRLNKKEKFILRKVFEKNKSVAALRRLDG